ncbi:MAG: hypothetical protein ABFS19_10860 [Thermodesulfobacteriota bacterium]
MMKNSFLTVLLLLCLSGCGLNPGQLELLQPPEEESDSLFNLKLFTGKELRFSGLIGLKTTDNGLHCLLLDASGIKLLEGSLDSSGQWKTTFVLAPFEQSGLVSFLALSLRRTYLHFPAEIPCSRSLLNRFCIYQEEQWQKVEQSGVVTVWQARYQKRPRPFLLQSAEFHHHLFDLTLSLKKI